jgi:vancomycin resistance protein YoaR
MELVSRPLRVPFPPRTASGGSRPRHVPAAVHALFWFLVTLATVGASTLSYLNGFAAAHVGRALPRTVIAGVAVGGLDRDQAEAAVRAGLPDLSSGRITVRVGREAFGVPFSAIERDYDMDAMLDAAFAPGHTGSALQDSLDGVRSLLRDREIAPLVRFDPAALRQRIRAGTAAMAAGSSEAGLALAPDASGFVVTPAAVGQTVDPSPAIQRALSAVGTLEPDSLTVRLRPRFIPPRLTTLEAQTAAAQARRLTDIGLALVGEGMAFQAPAESLRRWIVLGTTPEGAFSVTVDPAGARKLVEGIAPEVYRAPVNAELVSSGSQVLGYRASRVGRSLDVEQTTANVLAALEAAPPARGPKPVALVLRAITPDFTDAEAAAMVGPLVRLSSWTTPYTPSERNANGANIRVPTSSLDGYVLEPGESFAFWNAIGEVSTRTGYGYGGVIRNGHTDPTGALAGGICSCSTTLFNAVARAGLQILERHNHYYYIDRYPVGLDATVLKGSGGAVQDMRFRNDTRSPILIRGVNSVGKVTFEIYGVPDGRTVEWSTPIVKNRVNAGDEVWYTDSLPRGARKRTEYPTDGFDSWVTRTVRARDGHVIHQETFYSHYSRVNGITLVGR